MDDQAHVSTGPFYCAPDSLLPSRKYPQQTCYLEQYGTWANIDPQLTNDALFYQSELTEHNFDLHSKIRTLDRTFDPAKHIRPAPLAPSHGMYEQTSSQEWPTAVDIYNRVRYMSPNGPIGGSLSEVSSPSAYTSASISSPHFIQPSVSPNMLPINLPQTHQGHVFAAQYPPWEAEPAPTSYMTYYQAHPYQAPVITSNYPMYSSKDVVFNADECLTFEDELREEDSLQENDSMIKVEQHSSFRAPEEVQSVSEEAPTPSTTTAGTGQYTHPTSTMTSRDGYDDDPREMSVDGGDDRASDADWTAKPARSTRQQRNTTTSTPRRRRSTGTSQQAKTTPKSGPQTNSTARQASHNRTNSQAKLPSNQRVPPFVAKHNKQKAAPQERSFPCVFRLFGCTAIFANKNEWKRHVASQHLQLGYYRCDLGSCYPYNDLGVASSGVIKTAQRGRRPSNRYSEGEVLTFNDFNRKDLFTQHCRRMHGPQRTATHGQSHCRTPSKKDSRSVPHVSREDEEAFEATLEVIRRRCWHVRRKAPHRSSCGFCMVLFDSDHEQYQKSAEDGKSGNICTGPEERAWEDRMEHVGRHYEKGEVIVSNEEVDDDLESWGLGVGVLERTSSGKAWLTNATSGAEETNAATGRSHRRKRSKDCDDTGEETPETKRVRQQPLRRTRYTRLKQEETDSEDDDDAAQANTPVTRDTIKTGQESHSDSDSDAEGEDE